MRKFIIVLLLTFFFCSCTEKSEKVYIALQPPTKYYHSKRLCKYLIKAKVEEIKKKEALRYGKVPCRYCYSQYDIDEFNGELYFMKDSEPEEEEDEYYTQTDTIPADTMVYE